MQLKCLLQWVSILFLFFIFSFTFFVDMYSLGFVLWELCEWNNAEKKIQELLRVTELTFAQLCQYHKDEETLKMER
jgi:hypothetical protein